MNQCLQCHLIPICKIYDLSNSMKPFMDVEVPRCTLKTGQQKLHDFSVPSVEPAIETRVRSFDELSDVSERIKELTAKETEETCINCDAIDGKKSNCFTCKTDICEWCGVEDSDTKRMRGAKPFVFSNQKTGHGLDTIVAFIERQGLLIQ